MTDLRIKRFGAVPLSLEFNFCLPVEGYDRKAVAVPRQLIGTARKSVGTVRCNPPPNTVTDEYDEQYDRDRTRDNNGDGLGAFGGKAHRNPRWAGRTG